MSRLRRAAVAHMRRWAARRHGRDTLPLIVARRRIYIVPTRFGLTFGALLVAMLIGGLNYNSNLGLAFAFLMVSLALVAMHHCHRNLLSLEVDADPVADAFAGGHAALRFFMRNAAALERCDLTVICPDGSQALTSVAARESCQLDVRVLTPRRGVLEMPQFELRTRYPFGWFRAWTYVYRPLRIYVAPAPAGRRPLPARSAASGNESHWQSRGEEDFAGLRAYEPGIPLKHMAWKRLARGGEAAVRSYTGAASHPEWLTWDDLDGLDGESRLAQLCAWVIECEGVGAPYGLGLPDQRIEPGRGREHRIACLRALAAQAIES